MPHLAELLLKVCRLIFYFFLIWVLRPFQECSTYIEPIVHQRCAKTREPREKPPDHLDAELCFPTCDPEQGLNHSGEKPNGLRVNSPIH